MGLGIVTPGSWSMVRGAAAAQRDQQFMTIVLSVLTKASASYRYYGYVSGFEHPGFDHLQ